MVGAGAGQQVLADASGPGVDLRVQRPLHRIGVAEHVAIHIAAASDGVDQGAVDALDHALEVALEDAMVLEGLARGQAQGAVGQATAYVVDGKPLCGGAHPAGQPGAQHEFVIGLESSFLARLAPVPVVLLVEAVKLADLGVRRRQCSGKVV